MSELHSSINAAVAGELRARAARMGITQVQVAERADMPKLWAHRRLSAAVEINVADLVRLAAAVGAHPLDVFAQAITEIEASQPVGS